MITRFGNIGLPGENGERSINKLVEEAENCGYSNMTDAEINSLIDYRIELAKLSEEIEIKREESMQRIASAVERDKAILDLSRKEFLRSIGESEDIWVSVD